MDHENILAVDVPNAISITLMALVGFALLTFLLKLARGGMVATTQTHVPGI